jgi:hypothetical protein
MSERVWSVDGMTVIWRKESTRRKANRRAFRLTQIPHYLTWD